MYRGERDSGYVSEVYSMHASLSGGVVQVRTQIAEAIEHFKSGLEGSYEYELNRVHPKGVLITGRADGLSGPQKTSFNHFRQGQYSLTIITFDELLYRLRILYGVVPGEPDSRPLDRQGPETGRKNSEVA